MCSNQVNQSKTIKGKKNEYFQLDPSIGTMPDNYMEIELPSDWLDPPRREQNGAGVVVAPQAAPVPAVVQPVLPHPPVAPQVEVAARAPVTTSSQFVTPALQAPHLAHLQARLMPQRLFTSSAPQHPRATIFEENGYESKADASVPGPSSRIQARSPPTSQYTAPGSMRPQTMPMAPVSHFGASSSLSTWTVPSYSEDMNVEEDGYVSDEDLSVLGPSSRIQARSVAPTALPHQNRAPVLSVNHFSAPGGPRTIPGYQYQHSQYGVSGVRPDYMPKTQYPLARTQISSFEIEDNDEGAAPRTPLCESKAPQKAPPSKKVSKKKAKEPKNAQSTLLPDDQVLDTSDICKRVSAEIRKHSIPQGVFAREILGRSQGTLSDLLRNPKPWHEMKSGREAFRKMYLWLEMPEDQRLALVTKEKEAPVAPIEKKAPKQRMKFLEYQKQALERHFVENSRPSPETIKEMAEQLSLKYETVLNFFTNARRNDKRRKMKEEMKENVEEEEDFDDTMF